MLYFDAPATTKKVLECDTVSNVDLLATVENWLLEGMLNRQDEADLVQPVAAYSTGVLFRAAHVFSRVMKLLPL